METDKLKILDEILGSWYRSGAEAIFKCPKCDHHKKKLSVNIEKNVFKCWVCDYSGKNISSLVKRYGNRPQKEVWSTFDSQVNIAEFDNILEAPSSEANRIQLSLPKEYISLTGLELCAVGLRARAYLTNRGVDEQDIMSWRIGYCPSGEFSHRIIIPSFDMSGNLNYYVARTFRDEWPKYKNPPTSRDIIFNEIFLDWESDITIVEGVFDAIVAGNALPLLGSTLNERSKMFLEIVRKRPRIYFALDEDAAHKQDAMIKKFLQYDIEVGTIPTAGYEDVGSMTKGQFIDCKKKTTFIESSDYLLYQALRL